MKVIIDCDPGVDDMQALFLLLDAKHVEIVAVTTVGGNCSNEIVFRNAQRIMHSCGRADVPIYKGSHFNLLGKATETDSYFGKDGIGEIDHPYPDYKAETMTSAEALVHYVNKFPNEIVLLAVGPMTNLALAFLNDNTFPTKLKDLFLMVADVCEQTTMNCSPWAEFNAWCDPVSLSVVLKNFKLADGKPITILEFDFCRKNQLSIDLVKKFYGVGCEKSLNNRGLLSQKSYSFMQSKFSDAGVITADPFCVYLAIYPEVAEVKGYRADITNIVIDGEKIGHTDFCKNEAGNIFIVESINMKDFNRKLLLSAHEHENAPALD